MASAKASRRPKEAELRHRDVVLEALRRRSQSAAESLQVLSSHNEAVRRLNRARR